MRNLSSHPLIRQPLSYHWNKKDARKTSWHCLRRPNYQRRVARRAQTPAPPLAHYSWLIWTKRKGPEHWESGTEKEQMLPFRALRICVLRALSPSQLRFYDALFHSSDAAHLRRRTKWSVRDKMSKNERERCSLRCFIVLFWRPPPGPNRSVEEAKMKGKNSRGPHTNTHFEQPRSMFLLF